MSDTKSSARSKQADRNRTNQQNFRRRQHQRLQELETEVKHYRVAGVEATREVQHAAQIVVAENAVLRNILLKDFGLDAEALQQRVQERLGSLRNISTPTAAPSEPDAPRSTRVRHSHDANPAPLALLIHTPPSNLSPTRVQKDLMQSDSEGKSRFGTANPGACVRRQSPELSLRSSQRVNGELCSKEDSDSSMKMTCEKAAEILSHLRTQHTAEEIQNELGCPSGIARTCTIENIRLMEVMGRDV